MSRDSVHIYAGCVLLIYAVVPGCALFHKQDTSVFRRYETEERVERLQEQIRNNPADIEKRTELGKLFLAEDLHEQAIQELEQALHFDSSSIQARLLLAIAMQRRPDPDLERIVTLLRESVHSAPRNPDLHLHLAQALDRQRRGCEAITEFRKTIELCNDPAMLVSAHLGLMAIYDRHGETKQAQREYEAAHRLYPEVGEMIKQAEIQRITPSPRYSGEPRGVDRGVHPPLEERIERLRQQRERRPGGER